MGHNRTVTPHLDPQGNLSGPGGTPGPAPGPSPGGITPPISTPNVTSSGGPPGLFDQLIFGASGSGESGFVGPTSQPTTSSTQQLSLVFLQQLLTDVLGQSSVGGGNFASFEEQFAGEIPGQNPLQAMSLAGLERIAAGELDVFTGTEGTAARTTLLDLLGAQTEDTSAVFDATVAGPAQEDLRRALEEVNINAVGAGNLFGSERREQAGRTVESFLDDLSQQRTKFQFDAGTRARDTRLQALGLTPSILGLDVDIGTDLFGVGTEARAEEFKEFAAQLGLFDADRNRELQLLELLLTSSIAPTFGVTGGFATSGGSGQASGGLLGQFVSGLLT